MTRGVTASLRTVASSERVHSRESDSGVSSDSSLIIARFRSVGSDTPATCSRHAIARARARRGLVGSGSGSARALARRTGARARLCDSIPEASFRGVSPRPLPRGVRATASYSAASGSASDRLGEHARGNGAQRMSAACWQGPPSYSRPGRKRRLRVLGAGALSPRPRRRGVFSGKIWEASRMASARRMSGASGRRLLALCSPWLVLGGFLLRSESGRARPGRRRTVSGHAAGS